MSFSYENSVFEDVSCAICKGRDFSVLARRSKNNLAARTVMCKTCGLIFISPRMTSSAYDDYYKYFYRKDRDSIKGTSKEEDTALNFENAKKFGRGLAETMGKFLGEGLTIDIGSSTGGVLAGLREFRPGLSLLGVEPSVSESDYARKMAIETVTGLFENFAESHDYAGKAANIFCVQSLNHLLDPAGFVEWSYKTLRDGGHLFLAVKNFKHQVRRAGSFKAGVQIDHPYMFTPETLRLLVESRGFEVVYLDIDEGKSKVEIDEQRKKGLNKHHIRLAARKKFEVKRKPLRVSRMRWWR